MPLSPDTRDALAHRLAEIAAEAGAMLCRFSPGSVARDEKVDGSPVTAADKASEAVILARLAEFFPDWPAISEESADLSCQTPAGPFFLVDPLDGTKGFLSGGPDFCVLIALIEDRVPVAGAVHAPATGETWFSGAHAFYRPSAGAPVRVLPVQDVPEGRCVAVVSRLHGGDQTAELCASFGASALLPSNSALKFVKLACGEADIYPRAGRTMQWDVAAGDALLRATGGGVMTMEGEPLRYGRHGCGADQASDPMASDPWANPHFIAYRALAPR